MKCLVKNCVNHDHQGGGIWINLGHEIETKWVCIPCWDAFLGEDNAQYSQVFRNMKKQMFPPEHDVEEFYKDYWWKENSDG